MSFKKKKNRIFVFLFLSEHFKIHLTSLLSNKPNSARLFYRTKNQSCSRTTLESLWLASLNELFFSLCFLSTLTHTHIFIFSLDFRARLLINKNLIKISLTKHIVVKIISIVKIVKERGEKQNKIKEFFR